MKTVRIIDVAKATAPVVNVPVGVGTVVGAVAAAAVALIGSKIVGTGVKVIMTTPSTESDDDDDIDISSKE